MSEEKIDTFLGQFERPGAKQREERAVRQRKERRTQMTPKQRKRGAVRTEQINFRCSPEFKALADAMKNHLGGISIADVMEMALDLLADAKNYEGGKDA